MNDYEIEKIAHAVNVLRPDWPVRSLITLMNRAELKNRPRRDVLVAFAWISSEPKTSNPGRVLEAGPWWKAAAIETPSSSVRYPPKAVDECATHPGEWLDACRICAGPPAADGDEKPRPNERRPPSEAYQRARQAIKEGL